MARVQSLYAIYDHPHREDLPASEVVGALLRGGARTIQLRAKQADVTERVELLRHLAPCVSAAGGSLWVNDDLEAVLTGIEGVDGLHVGQKDLARLPAGWRERIRGAGLGVGISTHDLEQVASAQALDPDYLGFGPIFSTSGKREPDPVVGLDQLQRACKIMTRPVVAIGGLDSDRAQACFEHGASAVAVIGALVAADLREIEQRTRALVARCEAALATRGPGAPDTWSRSSC